MPAVVSAQPLVEAVEAAITAQGLAVGDGEKPASAPGRPYVVGWFGGGTIENRSMRSRDGFSLTFVLQVYGFDPDSIRWAVVRVHQAVLGLFGAVIDGRTVQMPVHQADQTMPERDDKADPPIWSYAEEWRIRTS